ncbi:hypothetical protein ACYCVF_25205 [Bradyrhizobium sp. 1.29L]
MPIKATAVGDLTRNLDQAVKAIQSLDGALTEVKFDPSDPSSVQGAIVDVEAAIDRRVGAYRGNPIVEPWIAEIKEKYRKELLDRAAKARAAAPMEQEMGDEAAIYRRLNNAAFDLSSADFQTYSETIKKLARLLRNQEIEPITQRLTQGIDLDAWVKGADETGGSWLGSKKLSWPADHEKELGTIILLIERMAEKDQASDIAYQFYYTGNNITSNLSNMTRQLIIPFVRDYVAYLKDARPAPAKKPEAESLLPAPMQAHPIHKLVGWSTTLVGFALICVGVYGMWVGATSSTEINIMGNSFKSGSVGIASIFIGAVVLILNHRRLLTSVERVR